MTNSSLKEMAAHDTHVKEEETNYARFSLGVIKATPQALRLNFKNRHPNLKTFLTINRKKCLELRNRKILSDSQWDLLYPATGAAALDDFDTTLLILLLRNVSNVPPPSTGWNNDPMPSDTSLGADILRLREMRNKHVHNYDARMKNSDFGKKWSELTMILTRVGGLQMQYDMNSLLQASSPLHMIHGAGTIKREIEQLRRELKRRIPENIKEREKRLLERATNLKSTFVKTRAYKHILKNVRKNSVLTITGTIGCGKKALALQLALYFSCRNYVIIPINDCQELLQCCIPEENQIFIINDPFGTTNLDTNSFAKWSRFHEDICYHLEHCLSSKIIFTCRLQIFKKTICKSSFDILYRNAINISDGPCELTTKDRQSLLQMHDLSIATMGNLRNVIHVIKNPSLPLLCQINNHKDRINFADTPLDIYTEEIRKLLFENAEYSFILHLILAEKNHFLKQDNNVHTREFTARAISDILEIPVPPMFHLRINSLLSELEGSFVKETGGIYSFINDTVYDIISFMSGLRSKKFAIANCSKEFFKNNFTFNPEKQYISTLRLYLEKEHFGAWFERLVLEIRSGSYLDILFCSEFFERFTTDLLLTKVKDLPLKELSEILCVKQKNSEFMDIVPRNITWILQYPKKSEVDFLGGILFSGHRDLFYVIYKRLKGTREFNMMIKDDILKAALIRGDIDILKKIVKAVWKKTHPLRSFVSAKHGKFYKSLLLKFSPMCICCALGNKDMIDFLHDLQFSLHERNRYEEGTLAHATRFNDEDLVRYLLSNNVDIDGQNMKGVSPLMMSVGNDSISEILLESGANIYLHSKNKENVLMIACELGKSTLVKKILDKSRMQLSGEEEKAFVNEQRDDGFTALHLACKCSDSGARLAITNMLLKRNASVMARDINLATPLHLASAKNDDRLVSLLLDMRNDNVNCTDKHGVTPLFIAAENCFPQIVSMLIEKGADISICRNTDGASPLLKSAERGHVEVVELLLQNMQHREDINCVNFQNSTALLLATMNYQTKVCEILLQYGADENITNSNGYSPILEASRNGNTRLIHTYLQIGANINYQATGDNNTSLHLAAKNGNKKAVKYLLVQGADIEIRNAEEKRSFDLANEMNQEETADLLMKFRKFGAGFSEFVTTSVESLTAFSSSSESSTSGSESSSPSPTDYYSGLSVDSEKTERSLIRRFHHGSDTSSSYHRDNGSIQSSCSTSPVWR